MARGYFQTAGMNVGETFNVIHTTLTASGWGGDSSSGFSQSIAALGVSSESECHPQIQLEHLPGTSKATWEAQCDAFNEFCITSWSETGLSTITFHTYTKPDVDLPVIVYAIDYTSNQSIVDGTTGNVSVVQSNVNNEVTIPSSKVVYEVAQGVIALNNTLSVGTFAPSMNTTYVSSMGSYTCCYKYGRVVVANFNMNLIATSSGNTTLLSGLPIPAHQAGVALVSSDNTTNVRGFISSSGTLNTDGGIPKAAWYNGSVAYLSAS